MTIKGHAMVKRLSNRGSSERLRAYNLRRMPFIAPVTMSVKRPRGPRPVFLEAALRRTLRQHGWRKRLRSLQAIASFVLSDCIWWIRRGFRQIPPTLRLAQSRITLPIHHNIPCPSVDVYIPPCQQPYLQANLAKLSCFRPISTHSIPIPPQPILVYVHGGSWGSGSSSHYSQLAHTLTTKVKATVLVVSYRLYPQATIDHQVADVVAALKYARRVFPKRPLAVLAHSSGAHLVAMALLARRNECRKGSVPLADVAILTAAPFHLMHHFLFEAGRGIADVSPMLPAACAEDDVKQFDKRSPSFLLENFEGRLVEGKAVQNGPKVLEGELAARNVPLPDVVQSGNEDENVQCVFPRTYVMTSSCDMVVPMYSSLRFTAALRRKGLGAKLLVYDFMEHVDFVSDWFMDAQSRDKSSLLDVDENDQKRRMSCVEHISGAEYSASLNESSQELGPTPFVRDVLRILESMVRPETPEDDNV